MVEQQKKPIAVRSQSGLIYFDLDGWHIAFFDDHGRVHVYKELPPRSRRTVAGAFNMEWVGRSATDREDLPVKLDEAKNFARQLGISLAELLDTN